MTDPYNLQRFVEAQENAFDEVLQELAAGEKQSHWMWFVFPQIAGLGTSSTAQYYAISGKAEAHAYLQHAVLGPRFAQCCKILNMLNDITAEDIFGHVDAMKLRSSLTLFAAAGNDPIYTALLGKYFDDKPDQLTLNLLKTEHV